MRNKHNRFFQRPQRNPLYYRICLHQSPMLNLPLIAWSPMLLAARQPSAVAERHLHLRRGHHLDHLSLRLFEATRISKRGLCLICLRRRRLIISLCLWSWKWHPCRLNLRCFLIVISRGPLHPLQTTPEHLVLAATREKSIPLGFSFQRQAAINWLVLKMANFCVLVAHRLLILLVLDERAKLTAAVRFLISPLFFWIIIIVLAFDAQFLFDSDGYCYWKWDFGVRFS